MTRTALILALLTASSATQDKRTVAQMLRDHGAALGNVSAVRALRATGAIDDVSGMVLTLRGGASAAHLPADRRTGLERDEYFDPGAGAFLKVGAMYERYRKSVDAQRALYYRLESLAKPFPLLEYVRNPAAAAGLRAIWAGKPPRRLEGVETPADADGVRVQYLLDEATHHLAVVRYVRGKQVLTAIQYDQYRMVDGVLLPGAARSFCRLLAESDQNRKKLVEVPASRVDIYARWEVNPDLGKAGLSAPGPGPFQERGFRRTVLATGVEPYEVAVGDIDADGVADIAVACHGALVVHFGGAWDKPVRVELSKWQLRGLAIEDLDSDGRPEVLCGSRLLPAETLHIVSFPENRRPLTRGLLGLPFLPHTIVCTDLDQDGLGDLVTTGWGARSLDLKWGNGLGAFRVQGRRLPLANKQNEKPRGIGVAVGRLDDDTLFDIVVADGTRLMPFMGRVNGAYLPGVAIEAGPRPVDLCFADLNGDGKQDLLVANDRKIEDLQGDLAILLNTGKGLRQHAFVESGARTTAVRAGWFNNDAHVDVATTSYLSGEVFVFAGDGKGGLTLAERLPSGRGTHRLCVADLDGDGKDDIVATNRLDDTVSLFFSKGGARAPRTPQPRARACKSAKAPFRLTGLTDEYDFVAEFRLPETIRDPSGIAFLGGGEREFVIVSDKEPSLFRAALDARRERLLVGPRIPLIGVSGRLDLEGATYDPSGNLFLACEADSSILRVSLFGHVLGRVKTPVVVQDNDGIEAVAVRRKKDGTPLLYVFKERWGKTLKRPPVYVLGMEEDPFALPQLLETQVPLATPDQTGAAVSGDRMFVVHRFLRTISELRFDGRGFSKKFKAGSYAGLTDDLLQLTGPYGVAEGIAVDRHGDLYLLVDNNGEVMGRDGLNRGREGRLLWFRARTPPKPPPSPRRVTVKHLLVKFAGVGAALTRTQAGALADDIGRAIRSGRDFDEVAKKHGSQVGVTSLVLSPQKPKPGEVLSTKVSPSVARLAFALELNEVGVAEFHHQECPEGFHVLLRIK